MFSGIVEEFAQVVGIEKEQENVHFTLKCSFVDELKIDQSVAHNGVCLTVVRIENGTYTVTAMKETLERSNLGLLKVGDKVNIERSMMMNGRLDGHIVQGHVDQTATCIAKENQEGSYQFTFKYKFDKGESAKIACKLEYDRHTKELELKIEPLYTTAAERFMGTVKRVYKEPSELLKQLHWVISDSIGKFTEKFREYLLYKENRDNEFAIDSMEYFSRLKEKYEPAGLKVTIEKGDTDGYIIEINDPAGGPNDDDDNYIKFTTAPAVLYTSDGYFRDFCQQMETDIEEREFTDIRSLFQGIEMLVDGALAWRKLFIDCEKRYCEMTVVSED